MPTINTSNQATDWAPKLCRKCANLNAPCSKLDLVVEYHGEVELSECGIFTPKRTPDEENPAKSATTANTAETPATETESDQDDKESTS
jgi:hypothetical protein